MKPPIPKYIADAPVKSSIAGVLIFVAVMVIVIYGIYYLWQQQQEKY